MNNIWYIFMTEAMKTAYTLIVIHFISTLLLFTFYKNFQVNIPNLDITHMDDRTCI